MFARQPILYSLGDYLSFIYHYLITNISCFFNPEISVYKHLQSGFERQQHKINCLFFVFWRKYNGCRMIATTLVFLFQVNFGINFFRQKKAISEQ